MTVYVGIDVSKAQLDLAVGPTGPVTQVANDRGGIATVVHEVQGVDALVVVEATGGYETAVVAALAPTATANKAFAALTKGKQREYADYITFAKREETKKSRLAKILPLIEAGGGLYDKYRSC